MQLGMIGLGKMGANMCERLLAGGHEVVGFDPSEAAQSRLEKAGGRGVGSLGALVDALDQRRVLWMMIPAGAPVDETIDRLMPALRAGDVLIDGGNSFYKDTQRRAARVQGHGVAYLDVGVSGGVWGKTEGYGLMVGGQDDVVSTLRPIFETLAPKPDQGWGHMGPVGAGHFVKMVHNGIEYGLMQAYAEGFAILSKKEEFELDLAQVAEAWRHGTVIRSWLLDLAARALSQNPSLEGVAPWVADSGEGRWTVAEAVDLDVPAPVITLSLLERFNSRDTDSYTYKMLSALRNQFGGHAIKEST